MATSNERKAAPAPSTKKRLMLLGTGDRPGVREEAERLRALIEREAVLAVCDLEGQAELDQVEVELAVVLGGDGSILRAARQMGYRQVPVVGVNLGRLGFLAALSPAQFVKSFPEICAGRYQVVEHLMCECEVLRGGRSIARGLALNEVAVLAGPPFTMLEVHLYVDAELATTYSCDGLIISTPVGSTAHNLSAGGPILRKDLQAFVIVPISPHTLTTRPVVDTSDRMYEMVVPRPNEGTTVVVDGVEICRLEADDRVRVQRAQPRFKLIELPEHGYYRTLRDKLGWGGRLQLNDR